MALKIIFFHLFTAMVAVNIIFADNIQLPSFFSSESALSRPARSADEPEAEEEESEQQERFFFANIISCNFTSEGGTSCPSCRQALACYPNNVGRLRTCRGLLRYCNNGRCSFVPGAQCTNSTG